MTMITRTRVTASISALLLFQVFALFVRALIELKLIQAGLASGDAKHLSYVVVPLILGILMYPMLRANCRYVLSLFSREALHLRLVLTAIGIGISARMTWWAQLVARISFGLMPDDHAQSGLQPVMVFACPPWQWLLLGVLVMVVLVPLIEELISRGFIQATLADRGRAVAIVASAALFAALHPGSSIPAAFAMGIVFGLQFSVTGALWASLVTHATYNALTQLDWRCLQITWNPPADVLPLVLTGTVAMLVLGIALAVLVTLMTSMRGSGPMPRCPARSLERVGDALDDM